MTLKLYCLEGLFKRAIILSGSAFGSPLMCTFQNFALRLAKKLGYIGTDEDRDVLEFLQSADPSRMAEEQSKIILPEERQYILFPYQPIVEPYITDDTFISNNSVESSRIAWGNDIDILVGGTSHEGHAFLTLIARDPTVLSQLDLDTAIPFELNLNDKAKREEFVGRIRELYYGLNDPTEDAIGMCEVSWGEIPLRIQRFVNGFCLVERRPLFQA